MKSELRELITQQKPQIIAICELKLIRHGEERTFQDYAMYYNTQILIPL